MAATGMDRMLSPCAQHSTQLWARRRRCLNISRRSPPTSSPTSRPLLTRVDSRLGWPRLEVFNAVKFRSGLATCPLATPSVTLRPVLRPFTILVDRRRLTSSGSGPTSHPRPRPLPMRSQTSPRASLMPHNGRLMLSGTTPTSSSSSVRRTQTRQQRQARNRQLLAGRFLRGRTTVRAKIERRPHIRMSF